MEHLLIEASMVSMGRIQITARFLGALKPMFNDDISQLSVNELMALLDSIANCPRVAADHLKEEFITDYSKYAQTNF